MTRFLVLLTAMFALAGCGGGSYQAATVSTSAAGVVGGSVTSQGKCGNSAEVGYVYDGGGASGSFASRVDGFISGNLDPSSFGEVSGVKGASTGIDLQLFLSVTGGKLNAGQTSMEMTIYDSLANTFDKSGNFIEAYKIPFSSATSDSTVNVNARTFTVIFQDSVGTITISGSWGSGAYATGTVTFRNNASVTGGTPASGLLGNFEVPVCSLF